MRVSIGSPELFMTSVNSNMTHGAIENIRTKASNFYGSILSAGEDIYRHAQRRMEEFISKDWQNKITGFSRQMEAIFKPNGMRPLLNIADMQNAPVQMQPYIMSHPTMHGLYKSETIAAYGKDAVFDRENCGVKNSYYREMTSGMAVRVENTDDYVIRNFYEKVDKDAIALTSDDRAACLVTCVAMEQLLDEQDYDPTDCWNGLI